MVGKNGKARAKPKMCDYVSRGIEQKGCREIIPNRKVFKNNDRLTRYICLRFLGRFDLGKT
jgi:hypothetical protein